MPEDGVILLAMPQGEYERLQGRAADLGMSANTYVSVALDLADELPQAVIVGYALYAPDTASTDGEYGA